jgi:hypothetical protein
MKKNVVLILFLVFACTAPVETENDQYTKIFSWYLQQAFNDSIPDQAKTWVLIPERGCGGCRNEYLKKISGICQQAQMNITVISSPALQDTSCKNKRIDTSKLIDELNLPISTAAIIKTKSKKVYSFQEILSADSIPLYLK